jgi:hypothetical protein
MNIIYDNYDLIFSIVIGFSLLLSWFYYNKAQYDERRKSRFGIRSFQRKVGVYKQKLFNEEYERFLRKNGLPFWITSERLNIVRIGTVFFLLLLVLLEFLTRHDYISTINLMMWGSLPVILTPKKPFPLYYLVGILRQKRANEISNEVYQLYNEIKSNFQLQNGGISSSYYMIQSAIPYYKLIKPTMEKMLPHLEKKKLDLAWQLFVDELEIKEAQMLGLVMKEVESMKPEQALLLLEQKRKEFSNNLYNRYTEFLRKRKGMIFVMVVVGFMTVFLNEVTVFFMWYKEVMSVVNQQS